MTESTELYFRLKMEVITTWRDLDPKKNGERAAYELQALLTYYTAILKGETTMAQLQAEGRL